MKDRDQSQNIALFVNKCRPNGFTEDSAIFGRVKDKVES